MILQANCQNLATLGWKSAKCCQTLAKLCQHFKEKIMISNVCANVESGAVRKSVNICKYCRSQKMLQNEHVPSKIGFDTAENELAKVSFLHFLIPQILKYKYITARSLFCALWAVSFHYETRKKAERLSSPIEISPNGLKQHWPNLSLETEESAFQNTVLAEPTTLIDFGKRLAFVMSKKNLDRFEESKGFRSVR